MGVEGGVWGVKGGNGRFEEHGVGGHGLLVLGGEFRSATWRRGERGISIQETVATIFRQM